MAQIYVHMPDFLHLGDDLLVVDRGSADDAVKFLLEIVPVAALEQTVATVVKALRRALQGLLLENYFAVCYA